MKTLAKVGVGCASAAAIASVGLALVAPRLVREASRVVGPMQKMATSQKALDELVDEVAWERPQREALGAEQLDRFFVVRGRMAAVRREAGPSLDQLPRKNVSSLEELRQVPQVIREVTDVVGAELDAFLAARMPPAEYHWVERLVYERWRGELRRAGVYPAALGLAASEIDKAAAGEADARVRARLARLADELRARRPPPPEGFDPATHALLLERIADVERYSLDDVVAPYIPVPR